MDRPFTKTQRIALDRLGRYRFQTDMETIHHWDMRDEVPEAWHTLERDIDVEEKKVKITLWLDESVAKFYRAQGKGYQARINRILGTYAQMKIARLLEIDDDFERMFGRKMPR